MGQTAKPYQVKVSSAVRSALALTLPEEASTSDGKWAEVINTLRAAVLQASPVRCGDRNLFAIRLDDANALAVLREELGQLSKDALQATRAAARYLEQVDEGLRAAVGAEKSGGRVIASGEPLPPRPTGGGPRHPWQDELDMGKESGETPR
jgi:hypothetical protein